MRGSSVVGVAGVGVAALAGCGREARPTRAPAAGAATLEVMTYNVNFGIEGDPETIAVIEAEDADLVLLQETTPGWERAVRARLGGRYEHIAFRHFRGAGGQAVLSKHAFVERGLHAPPKGGWFPAWQLEVESPIGPLQVLSVHLRPQLSESGSFVSGYFSTPGVRFDEMASHFEHLDPKLPTLVVGDFNEGRRGLAIGYLERRGFTSALAQFESASTWRWRTSVGTLSAELDHIVYAPPLEPLEVRVVRAGRSDHLPVVARFALSVNE